ncbi:hypothetical protein K402DRAFT_419805 [Aulographum hederae CBS 113979]|uniref:Uncharacterized protein n=1 Tax=Aulographum hederae CBS 113979 TaxID=1176131 RepID=A0A6G1H4F1_9PEZI|nr:hypothetical protein K402DRAFT_419805 [Aulographum hederae CBS 113979]
MSLAPGPSLAQTPHTLCSACERLSQLGIKIALLKASSLNLLPWPQNFYLNVPAARIPRLFDIGYLDFFPTHLNFAFSKLRERCRDIETFYLCMRIGNALREEYDGEHGERLVFLEEHVEKMRKIAVDMEMRYEIWIQTLQDLDLEEVLKFAERLADI